MNRRNFFFFFAILEFLALKYFYICLYYMKGVLTNSIYFSWATHFSKFIIQALVICDLCPLYVVSNVLSLLISECSV